MFIPKRSVLMQNAKTLVNKGKDIFFAGVSELYYPFRFCPIDAYLPNKAAVYIYTNKNVTGFYTPLYVGQTDALDKHIDDYQTGLCIIRHFGNALYIHLEKDLTTRCQIVHDLIDRQKPVCNRNTLTTTLRAYVSGSV